MKTLEHLLLPFLTKALDTRVSQHSFKPKYSCVSSLLPLVSRVTEGFNMKKPPGCTVAVAVDLFKDFDSVSHVRLLEMIHQSRLQHNVVRWLTIYVRGRLSACLYLGYRAPYCHVRAGDPRGSSESYPYNPGGTWDTHLTFAAHARDIIARSASSLRINKVLAGTNWGFDKETLVHTYNAISRPVLNYGAPHLDSSRCA